MRGILISITAVTMAATALASDSLIQLSGKCTVLRFDKPSRLINRGTKLTVCCILNPTTGKWELVWNDRPWKETWVNQYLRFEGTSDDVHNGGSVMVIQPVTIAVAVFGEGTTSVQVATKPSSSTSRREPPAVGEEAEPPSTR